MTSSGFKHKVGQGSVFRNDRKETETQADDTGSCDIGGEEYWISMWSNAATSTKKGYFALKFNKKEPMPDNG